MSSCKHRNRVGAAGLLSKTFEPPYLPRSPRQGDVISRLWQGRHNSGTMLLVRLASIPGLRHKSMDGREQVSLFPALSSRPKCRIGSEACGGRSDSLFITSRLSVMASRLMSLSRGSCAYNTVYSVFKASVKNLRKVSFTNRRKSSGFTPTSYLLQRVFFEFCLRQT